jgi:hypothetical protein
MAVRKKIEYQQEQERERALLLIQQQDNINNNMSLQLRRPIINNYNLVVEIYNIVECPRSYDVLFRKGGSSFTQNHPGNIYFHHLIETTHDEHFKFGIKDKKQKVEMTWYIISQIENQAQNIYNNDYNCCTARFLEWSAKDKWWLNITNDRESIRTKVAATYTKYKYKKPTPTSASTSTSTSTSKSSVTTNRNIISNAAAGEQKTSALSSLLSNNIRKKASFWDIGCDDCIGTTNNDMVW